jgi:hypothetical protein
VPNQFLSVSVAMQHNALRKKPTGFEASWLFCILAIEQVDYAFEYTVIKNYKNYIEKK